MQSLMPISPSSAPLDLRPANEEEDEPDFCQKKQNFKFTHKLTNGAYLQFLRHCYSSGMEASPSQGYHFIVKRTGGTWEIPDIHVRMKYGKLYNIIRGLKRAFHANNNKNLYYYRWGVALERKWVWLWVSGNVWVKNRVKSRGNWILFETAGS